jgi:hypothetical protein
MSQQAPRCPLFCPEKNWAAQTLAESILLEKGAVIIKLSDNKHAEDRIVDS